MERIKRHLMSFLGGLVRFFFLRNKPFTQITIIGGSGLTEIEGVKVLRKIGRWKLLNMYGMPSSPVSVCELYGIKFLFLNRHGEGHIYSPLAVPNRANFYALKILGVQQVIAVSACGSISEDIPVGMLVVPDQLSDQTKKDPVTFFDQKGCVVHTSMAKPFCEILRQLLIEAIEAVGCEVCSEATYATIGSPWFSSEADSSIYRLLLIHILGMTTVTEARAAIEAGMCCSVIAVPTDKDVGTKEEEGEEAVEAVSARGVEAVFAKMMPIVQKTIAQVFKILSEKGFIACGCRSDDVKNGIQTKKKKIPWSERRKLEFLTGKPFNSLFEVKADEKEAV